MVLGWGKKTPSRQETEEEMTMEEILASIRKYVSEEQPDPDSSKAGRQEDLDNGNLHVTRSLKHPQESMDTSSVNAEIPSFFSQSETARAFESSRAPAFEPRNVFDPQNEEGDPDDRRSRATTSRKETSSSIASVDTDHSIVPEYPVTRSHLGSSSFEEMVGSVEDQEGEKWEEASSFEDNLASINEKETQQRDIINQEKEGFLSDTTLSMASKSFAKLIDVSRLATSSETTGGVGQEGPSALTLDRLMGDLARPIIQNWVDQHLPAIVEDMVSKEIDRITKQLGLKK